MLKKNFAEFDNFVFSNSGSEANIRALRIARSSSEKIKFAMVNGSWHGSVDNFMFDFKKGNKILPSSIRSLSSGINYLKKDIYLLPYNDIKLSSKILKKNKNKISVIVIEPIQCGIPYEKSLKYLKFLEKFAKKNKILLWFDEVITGLRVEKLAVYKKFNLKPDIVTFAKCFGGGMPIGITAFNSKLLRTKDTRNIFFGGTFSGNPISTKVGLDTFKYIKNNQKVINLKINKLAKHLTETVNDFCKIKNINFRLQKFESIVRPIFYKKEIKNRHHREFYDKNFKKSLELKSFLEKNNFFISFNCCFFISYCHTKKNIDELIKILKKFINQ